MPAADVIATYRSLQRDHPGRFIVGLGGAHGARPLETLNAYLDALDAAGIPAEARVLAALGPNMLALARDRAGGAYPFLVTPSYVTDARAVLGADQTLAVLLMVMPTTDREAARRAAATPLDFLTKVGGYRRNLLRQGFSESDIDDVSDRLLDGITAWGELDSIAARVAEYRAAGADQVVLRILGVDDVAGVRRPGWPKRSSAEPYPREPSPAGRATRPPRRRRNPARTTATPAACAIPTPSGPARRRPPG